MERFRRPSPGGNLSYEFLSHIQWVAVNLPRRGEYSLQNTVEDYGSAKELSELRANQILEYLASKGIDRKRMSIKAWGGKKPLYNVDDAKAEANVRVEIEVVKSE